LQTETGSAESTAVQSCHVCVNTSCAEWGSEKVYNALVERLEGTGIPVHKHICFGACWTGPNIILFPEGTWYANVEVADVDEIVGHIKGGEPLERRVYHADPTLKELTLSMLDMGI
jgi:(2Fe-2S) ferredoxin